MNVERSGHVWVQVIEGDESYSLRCMTMAPFSDEDLDSEVLVWEHSLGVGVVIARGLDSHPPSPAHTRESFVRTMEVLPHELKDAEARTEVALAATMTTTNHRLDPHARQTLAVTQEALEEMAARAQ